MRAAGASEHPVTSPVTPAPEAPAQPTSVPEVEEHGEHGMEALRAMSVRQLRAMMSERGLSHEGLLEKSEFVAAIASSA